VALGEFVIAIVIEPETVALFLFRLGKVFDGAALDGDCRGGGRFGTQRRGQSQAGGRSRQQRARWLSGGRGGVLLPQFELECQTHGYGQGLGVLDPDVDAERRLETPGEQLNLLCLGKRTSTREERLEPILILSDRVHASAFSQFGQRGRAQRRPITQVQQLLEVTPGRGALVRLDLDVPHLRALLQVVGGHPDLLLLHDPLLMEI
jgi:hypothetical protein